jgi:hypothetical protein
MQATSVSPALRPHLHLTAETCPWCEQPLPRENFAEIRTKIETKEREHAAGIERRLWDQFKAEAEALAKSAIEQVRRDAAAQLENARREADLAAQKRIQEAVTAARLEGKNAAETALAEKLASNERAREEAEQARAAAEGKQASMQANHEAELASQLAEQREALEKSKLDAILAEQAKTFDERQKLQSKVQELTRQLENKTAAELGEGAELDLFELLKGAFEDDRIRRVAKGAAGADIIHEVVQNGQTCGKIVYDSKNWNAWRTEHATKLRADQIAEKADHAVLSTNKFPAGAHQLHIYEGVIIACPARVLAIAEILRAHVVQAHGLRVSNHERESKTAALYAFITSERCNQLLGLVETLIGKLEEIDVAEQKAHATVWEKRGRMLRQALKTHTDICLEINRIIGTAEVME